MQKKKLIIVYDTETEKQAYYLLQMISNSDDTDEKSVGVKDGTVDATMWDEKRYVDNRPGLSSATYVLFMGNGSIAKMARAHIPEVYGNIGMHYGWLGTQGFLYVDDASLDRGNYPEFEGLCRDYRLPLEKPLALLKAKHSDEEGEPADIPAEDVRVEVVEDAECEIDENPHDPETLPKDLPVKIVAEKALTPFRAIAKAAGKAGVRIGALISGREAKDIQYSLLVRILYLDALAEFLGE